MEEEEGVPDEMQATREYLRHLADLEAQRLLKVIACMPPMLCSTTYVVKIMEGDSLGTCAAAGGRCPGYCGTTATMRGRNIYRLDNHRL